VRSGELTRREARRPDRRQRRLGRDVYRQKHAAQQR
jgi:hypothetical protein